MPAHVGEKIVLVFTAPEKYITDVTIRRVGSIRKKLQRQALSLICILICTRDNVAVILCRSMRGRLGNNRRVEAHRRRHIQAGNSVDGWQKMCMVFRWFIDIER